MDKGKAIEAAVGQIERAFGKGAIMRLGQRHGAARCLLRVRAGAQGSQRCAAKIGRAHV